MRISLNIEALVRKLREMDFVKTSSRDLAEVLVLIVFRLTGS